MQMVQRDLYTQLRDESVASRERIATMLRPIDAASLNEHPEPNGWSIAQVLEHLCKANELYERPMTVLLSQTNRDAGAVNREWKSSFVGGLIAKSLLNPKPLKRGPAPSDPARHRAMASSRRSTTVRCASLARSTTLSPMTGAPCASDRRRFRRGRRK